MPRNFQIKIKNIRDDLGKIHAVTEITSAAMAQFTEGTQGVVENMAEAAQNVWPWHLKAWRMVLIR